jgi:hypothetical protein
MVMVSAILTMRQREGSTGSYAHDDFGKYVAQIGITEYDNGPGAMGNPLDPNTRVLDAFPIRVTGRVLITAEIHCSQVRDQALRKTMDSVPEMGELVCMINKEESG